jgi:uncharacterized membrane protein
LGVVLGRADRINSWDLFSKPGWVINSIIHDLHSIPLLSFILFFGLLANAIYFGLKRIILPPSAPSRR